MRNEPTQAGDTNMPTYEQKLTEFAQGKRLLRLARTIRDRADAICDASGSTQPRTLYALADLDSERHSFVGDSCLKELAQRGAILGYGRRSGREAFESDMQLRDREYGTNGSGRAVANGSTPPTPGEQRASAGRPPPIPTTEVDSVLPAIFVI